MNDPDIEQALSRFKLKKPSEHVRSRVLGAAHEAWQQKPQAEPAWGWSNWCWSAYYATAAALLLLLNGVVTHLDQVWTAELIAEKDPAPGDATTAFEQLCVETGRDPAFARRLRLLVARPEPKGTINDFLRQKNELMQAIEAL